MKSRIILSLAFGLAFPLFSDSKVEAEVKITSVTADTVSGEVNVTDGGNSIKGNFTAKLPKAK